MVSRLLKCSKDTLKSQTPPDEVMARLGLFLLLILGSPPTKPRKSKQNGWASTAAGNTTPSYPLDCSEPNKTATAAARHGCSNIINPGLLQAGQQRSGCPESPIGLFNSITHTEPQLLSGEALTVIHVWRHCPWRCVAFIGPKIENISFGFPESLSGEATRIDNPNRKSTSYFCGRLGLPDSSASPRPVRGILCPRGSCLHSQPQQREANDYGSGCGNAASGWHRK